MRLLIADLKNHLKDDFDKYTYFYIISLAIILITINYSVGFEQNFVRKSFGKPIGYVVYTIYYASSYFLALLPFLAFKNQISKIKNPEFWVKSCALLILLGIFASFDHHRFIVQNITNNQHEIKYLGKLVSFLKRIIPYFIIILILYLIFDKNKLNFYGLRMKGLNYKPFIYIALFLFPFLLFASLLPDIQSYYPQFKYWNYQNIYNLNKLEMNLIFLVCYAVDFVGVELFFRGAMVLGFISILGRDAILPAALLYVVIHFGKPLSEAVSSFFGAYVLSIIAYKYKNIMGGIILHICLALTIEILTIIQYWRLHI